MRFKNLENAFLPLDYSEWRRMREKSPHAPIVLNEKLIKKPGVQVALFKKAKQAAAAGVAFEWRVGSTYLHRIGSNLTALCPIYSGTPETVLADNQRESLNKPSLATCLFHRHATTLASRVLASFRTRHARLFNSSWVAVHVRRGDKIAVHGCNTTVPAVYSELERQLGKERPPLAVFSDANRFYRKSLADTLRPRFGNVLLLDGEMHKLAGGLGLLPLDNQLISSFIDSFIDAAPSSIELGSFQGPMRPGTTCEPIIHHKRVRVTSKHGGSLSFARRATVWPLIERAPMTAKFGRTAIFKSPV